MRLPLVGSLSPRYDLTNIATPPDCPPLGPSFAGVAVIFHPFLSAHAETAVARPCCIFLSCANTTWAEVAARRLFTGFHVVPLVVSIMSWKCSG